MVTVAAPAADGSSVWWLWIVGGLVAWTLVGFLVAIVIGRGIRIADRRTSGVSEADVLTSAARVPGDAHAPAATRARRRAIPLPPIGITLAAMAVGLEASGFVARLTGSTGSGARLLSMDAPFSLPRLFVAALFAAAALAAVAGAGSLPGRRAWWLAVGLVGGGIAAVKAGSTVHAEALDSLRSVVGGSGAVGLSAGMATVVVGALWFLSRDERRDRRRVLGVLALYAVAAVGLSAVSSGVSSNWAATATFVEESGEALAAVAFLMAVLAGVAPRLVLPAAWPLRRTVDAQTLDLPERVPGRSAIRGDARG